VGTVLECDVNGAGLAMLGSRAGKMTNWKKENIRGRRGKLYMISEGT